MDDIFDLLAAIADGPAPQLSREEEAFVAKAAEVVSKAVREEGLPMEVGMVFGFLVAELAPFVAENYVYHGLGVR